MDLDHPAALFSGLFIGVVGMAIFLFGKKQSNPRCLLAGGALCIFPYFVTSLLIMWGLTALCLTGLYITSESRG